MSGGIMAQIFRPRLCTVLTFLVSNICLEQYFWDCLSTNTSLSISGDKLCTTLITSIASDWTFLTWIVKDLSNRSNSLKVFI